MEEIDEANKIIGDNEEKSEKKKEEKNESNGTQKET